MQANGIDVAIIVIYVLISLVFGVCAHRILKTNTHKEEGFFLGGRKIPGWLNGVSYAATIVNADVAPAYFGMAVVIGLPVCWFYLSRFSFGLLVAGLLFAARWRRLGVATGPEFFALRFAGTGGKFIRIWSSMISVLFGLIPWIGAGLLGMHMILAPFLGLDSKTATLLIVVPVLVVYVLVSGFAGVLVTDLIQTVIIILGSLAMMIAILAAAGGPAALAHGIAAAHGTETSQILSVLPQPGHEVFGPVMVVAWLLVATIGVGGNYNYEGQRILSCSSVKEAVKVNVWAEAVLFVMLLMMTLPALGALVFFPEYYHATPAVRETVYSRMLMEYVPTGLRGLAYAALMASVMSTVSGQVNYGAQTLLNDVVKPVFGQIRDNKAVWIGRALMVAVLLLGIIVVYYSKSLVDIAVLVLGLFSSTALVGWGQWWWWRTNIWSWVSANVAGPIVYFSLGPVLAHIPWWQQQVSSGASMYQQMNMLKAIIGICITTLIWITVTLLTKPAPMDVLKAFYLKARPMGAWGPVRRAVAETHPEFDRSAPKGLITGGIITTLAGTALMSLAVMGLSELFVAEYVRGGLLLGGALICGFIFKWMFNWHLDRLETDESREGNDGYEKTV